MIDTIIASIAIASMAYSVIYVLVFREEEIAKSLKKGEENEHKD